MPQRASHIPHANERSALQKMRLREQLTIEKLHPAGKQTIDKMLEKGWIERGSDAVGRAVYCITTIGQEALRAYIPG